MPTTQIENARFHRSRLHDVTFIGITGSCGKTTTKDLLAGLLNKDLIGLNSPDHGNCGSAMAEQLLRVKSDHDFYIQELGAWGPATLDTGVDLTRPTIGVVLNIRNDHHSGFRGLSNTQEEKSKVVRCLPPSGTAVLNADDPLVFAMQHLTSAMVTSFGVHPNADFRATNVHSAWPDRLSFDVSYRGATHRVNTQLLGQHLLGSALAALAVAVTMGVPLEIAVQRIEELPPTDRRMSAVSLDSGVTFIRDDFKATNDSMPEVVRFLENARARRKIAVVGRISDHAGRSRRVYTTFAAASAEVVDLLVFVGERPEDLWGRDRRNSATFLSEFASARARVELFETVKAASKFLRLELRSGDLVMLKASGVSDHLERALLQYQTEVSCWERDCGRVIACDSCDRLAKAPRLAFSQLENSR